MFFERLLILTLLRIFFLSLCVGPVNIMRCYSPDSATSCGKVIFQVWLGSLSVYFESVKREIILHGSGLISETLEARNSSRFFPACLEGANCHGVERTGWQRMGLHPHGSRGTKRCEHPASLEEGANITWDCTSSQRLDPEDSAQLGRADSRPAEMVNWYILSVCCFKILSLRYTPICHIASTDGLPFSLTEFSCS